LDVIRLYVQMLYINYIISVPLHPNDLLLHKRIYMNLIPTYKSTNK